MRKLKWGILSTAKIGREKVIPAMQAGELCEVIAIASRSEEHAAAEARRLNIPKVYGSYEALLADDEVEAVYIPLPNHMHLEWALKAIEANKHILCEKPITLSAVEAEQLLAAAKAKPHLKVMEAFMYIFHPQWVRAKELVNEGRIGELRTMQCFFSYHNVDPNNIRNKVEAGGGGMMDIGCYCISQSRFIFDKEPQRVFGLVERDPIMQTDRVASGILDFETGTSSFTCSTQMVPYQRVNIVGTEARIEIEIPVNAAPDTEMRIWLHSKAGDEVFMFDKVDQYTLQANAFSKSILNDTPVPISLEDAVNNMRVIECIFESSTKGAWCNIG